MPAGRPTLYQSEFAEIARKACAAGATNQALATRLGVARGTVDNRISTIPEFGEAVRQGRAAVANHANWRAVCEKTARTVRREGAAL